MKKILVWFILILTIVNTILLVKEARKTQYIVNQILPIEKVYMHPFGDIDDPYREDLHGNIKCSCVRAVRSFGANIPYDTDAENIEPNSEIEVGAVAIFKTVNYSHIAIVTNIKDSTFWVKEANYLKCQITEREINFDDERLVGFYK